MFNCKHICLQIYKNNFGYTQVLFMGSVPRINRLLATVSRARNRIFSPLYSGKMQLSPLPFWIILRPNMLYSSLPRSPVKRVLP